MKSIGMLCGWNSQFLNAKTDCTLHNFERRVKGQLFNTKMYLYTTWFNIQQTGGNEENHKNGKDSPITAIFDIRSPWVQLKSVSGCTILLGQGKCGLLPLQCGRFTFAGPPFYICNAALLPLQNGPSTFAMQPFYLWNASGLPLQCSPSAFAARPFDIHNAV